MNVVLLPSTVFTQLSWNIFGRVIFWWKVNDDYIIVKVGGVFPYWKRSKGIREEDYVDKSRR